MSVIALHPTYSLSFSSLLSIINLWQVSARKLKPQTQPPPTLHERILEEIKAERKLRPVSPDVVRRGRLGKILRDSLYSLLPFHILHLLYTQHMYTLVHMKPYFTLKCISQAEVWSLYFTAPAGHHVTINYKATVASLL